MVCATCRAALLIASDGVQARIGALGAGKEWFKPWRTISGETLASSSLPQLQVMIDGAFDTRRVLDLIEHFIVFEDASVGPLAKKMAGYHQFHAVRVAVAETLRAAQLRTYWTVLAGTDAKQDTSRELPRISFSRGAQCATLMPMTELWRR